MAKVFGIWMVLTWYFFDLLFFYSFTFFTVKDGNVSVKGCSYVLPSLPSVTKSSRWRKKNVDQFGVMNGGFRVKKKTSKKTCGLYKQSRPS